MRPHTVSLAGGDIVAILAFAALGRSSHGLEVTLPTVGATAWPFLIGWLLVGIPFGIYKPKAYASAGRAAGLAAISWLIAAPVALLLRTLALGSGFHWSFAVIAFLTNLILLTGWRALFASWRKGA